MKLAVSHIAWEPDEEAAAAAILARHGVSAVEVAPARVGADPRAYRAGWEARGFRIVAMQALLFGHPELALFEDEAGRRAMAEHLKRVIALGGTLGASALVFGSPRNRRRGALEPARALDVAVGFFGDLGRHAVDHGTCLCIEPNPPDYDCDFVTTSAEGRALVEAVGSPGFALHLDGAAMAMVGEDIASAVSACAPFLRHCHLSASRLEPPCGVAGAAARDTLRALHGVGYAGHVSIEMRSNYARLDEVLSFVRAGLQEVAP